ncbi:DUF1992 domain-containing protein [Paucibacter sp. B2R-40]|uniref:DUF1992 domain-containing protein n=1 Tax=Paucibacter sp. B2R-40 TaxID=2893554 RepID=UPI0021E478E4|nr:DUF1992 domain-containing protein [Paucibacter sp. B2R-40]MCV2357026.1 DUF1992 domain-containing protein [Paucibacter sp. B2R-40]
MRDDEIALHLQQALASGELQSAESFGKPLAADAGWEATPDSLRMPFKILKNAGFAPPEVALFHQKAALQAQIAACSDETERRQLQEQLGQLAQQLALRLEALRSSGQF